MKNMTKKSLVTKSSTEKSITKKLDEIYSKELSKLDPAIQLMQLKSIIKNNTW
jgi:hypothetical protein